MRIPRLFLCACLLMLATGCLMSEQIGEPVGHGNHRMPGDDVAFHFDTDFNRLLIAGRSALMLIVAVWLFKAWKGKGLAALLAGGLVVAAIGLAVKDLAAMDDYYLEVAPGGLTLRVPPDLDVLIPWQSVEELQLEGMPYSRIGGHTATPWGRMASVSLELPDWATMTITLTGGESHVINLKVLSIEHRQIFAKALIKRAGLVQVE